MPDFSTNETVYPGLHDRPVQLAEFTSHLLQKVKTSAAELADTETRQKCDSEDQRSKLVCIRCGHPITSHDQRIEVNGANEHTFANPSGNIFHIGCFRTAPGAITMPGETMDFTWFAGFGWSVSGCSLCGEHLGWRFRSSDDLFYGLILDRLVEKDEEEH